MNIKDYKYKVTAAGRVNIIGEHVDYCGGKVFPAALSLNNTVYVKPNGTNKINIKWTTLPDEVSLDIDRLDSYTGLKYGNYQAGSAYMWQQAGHKVLGCDMLHDCTVPFGSGLSSSAAIEVSTIAALAAISGEMIDAKEIAILARKAEHEYTGVNCGIMDQFASACGKKNMAMCLDCKEIKADYVPLDLKDYALVITNCNKPHNLVESKYNERRGETEKALEIFQTKLDVSCLADVTEEQFAENRHLLDEVIAKRAEHVVFECARVNKAVEAMRSGDLIYLGQLLNASHHSLSNLYEVTGKELDTLQAVAEKHPACIGSRMTGAGFGGCTISLVKKDGEADFKRHVEEEYTRIIGYAPTFYSAEIGDGITVTELN